MEFSALFRKRNVTMLITACLTVFMVACLFAGTLPTAPLAVLCAACAGVLLVFGRHSHGGILTIDSYAQRSRLSGLPPAFKTVCTLVLLLLCVCSHNPWPPLAMFAVMLLLTVAVGGMELHDYLSMLALPAVFLLMSGIALLWDYAPSPDGVLRVGFFHGWLVVTPAAQATARLVMARAFGAVSCLYFLSLSTPMSELISVVRKAHVPTVVIELAVLIYRYIFVLLSTYHSMKDAAASRLGYDGLKQSLRTTGKTYGNLLARSFRRAGACLDAMESRCYDGDIRFLERERKPVPAGAAVTAVVLIAAMAAGVIVTW